MPKVLWRRTSHGPWCRSWIATQKSVSLERKQQSDCWFPPSDSLERLVKNANHLRRWECSIEFKKIHSMELSRTKDVTEGDKWIGIENHFAKWESTSKARNYILSWHCCRCPWRRLILNSLLILERTAVSQFWGFVETRSAGHLPSLQSDSIWLHIAASKKWHTRILSNCNSLFWNWIFSSNGNLKSFQIKWVYQPFRLLQFIFYLISDKMTQENTLNDKYAIVF